MDIGKSGNYMNSGSNIVGCAQRELAQSIIQRRIKENSGRAELYEWLNKSLNSHPLSQEAEEALWRMITVERPY